MGVEESVRPSVARERLVNTAAGIFYSSGIHSVGVERIVAEAKVTRATFYRHFPGKEDLVVAYLQRSDQAIRAKVEQAVSSGRPPADIIRDLGRGLTHEIRTPGFRGCAFLNAAAEYPDPAHPVHRAVVAHREWFLATVTDLFGDAGIGRHFVMLRDGVMAAGYLDDPALAGVTFLAGIDGLLALVKAA